MMPPGVTDSVALPAPRGLARPFSYEEMTSRNLGFLNVAEQKRLERARVFVCGVGGMGGAALTTLVRAGVREFIVADPDRFELSNLNRQLLATLQTLGQSKVNTARRYVTDVNPTARVRSYGGEWIDALDEILSGCSVIVNGMDDVRAAIRLYREAARRGVTVIDAYSAPLPSVVRVEPGDPRPEVRLGFPSVGLDPSTLTDEQVAQCVLREIEYVVTHSSSLEHIDPDVATEVAAGTRARPSFAPVVLIAGQLMAGEAMATILGRRTRTDYRGWFLNLSAGRVERPRGGPLAWVRTRLARRSLAGMGSQAPKGSEVLSLSGDAQ